jgi:peptide deformylase
MVRDILQLGDARLRQRSESVTTVSQSQLASVWVDLKETLADVMLRHEFRNSAGLSAVQIGVLVRSCIVWTPMHGQVCIADPVVTARSSIEDTEFEGCLSFFDKRGRVPRAQWIELNYLDQEMTVQRRRLDGWEARIVLHEMDHMDGILYTDRMAPGERLISYEDYAFSAAQVTR